MLFNRTHMRERVHEIVRSELSEDIEEVSFDAPDSFEAAMERRKTSKPTFELPGFEFLSKACGGIGEKGFTVITGPTGAGKTTFVANLWLAANAAGKNIFSLPIEIGAEDFMDALFSIVSGKQRKSLTFQDYETGKMKWLPNYFYNRGHVFARHESRLTHIDFLAETYYHFLTRKVSVVFADNWNFMLEPASGSDANALNDKALHDCIVFTKKVPVHIFMIMHPRKPESGAHDRVVSMYDVKGSSTSIQEAQNVWLFNRLESAEDAPPEANPETCREIKIAKSRYNGRAMGTKIIYQIDASSELYSEYKVV